MSLVAELAWCLKAGAVGLIQIDTVSLERNSRERFERILSIIFRLAHASLAAQISRYGNNGKPYGDTLAYRRSDASDEYADKVIQVARDRRITSMEQTQNAKGSETPITVMLVMVSLDENTTRGLV